MLNHTKTNIPKPIENLKMGPQGTLTAAQFETWQMTLLSHVKKDIN